jgi:NAD(P)-dependent dehydrogenase (short-subunit alcohol dehydrogenase family)
VTLAWVIGDSSGIGKATAGLLKDTGFDLISTPEMDVREPLQVGQACDRVLEGLGDDERLCVVYSAGVNELEWIKDLSEHAIGNIMNVNVLGFMRVMQGLASHIELQHVRVVAVTSDAGTRPLRTSMAYCASKAALDMAVRVAAREMAERNWRVNAIAPGMVADTGMTHYIDKTVPIIRQWSALQTLEYELAQAVVKRRAAPIEVAHVILQLLDGPDYLNGAILPLNGGR